MIDRKKDELCHEMLSDEGMYDRVDEELIACQHVLLQRLSEFNCTDETPEGMAERDEILREICGTYGEGRYIIQPVYASSGLQHVHLGHGVVVNFDCKSADIGGRLDVGKPIPKEIPDK